MTETGEPSSKSTPINWKAGKVQLHDVHITLLTPIVNHVSIYHNVSINHICLLGNIVCPALCRTLQLSNPSTAHGLDGRL